MSKSEDSSGAMRFAFWSWMSIICVGLAIMIVLPLMGW